MKHPAPPTLAILFSGLISLHAEESQPHPELVEARLKEGTDIEIARSLRFVTTGWTPEWRGKEWTMEELSGGDKNHAMFAK